VNVTVVKIKGGYAACVAVEVKALVPLAHSSKIAGAAIWSEGWLLAGPASSCKQQVEEVVGEKLDLFANDYLAANPR